jgi:hypothetical protein
LIHGAALALLTVCLTLPAGAGTCPTSSTDTVVSLPSVDRAPAPGKLLMTVTGVDTDIRQNSINSIQGLLAALPDHMKKNFSLVEVTRTPGRSSLELPRIVYFGSDARFMMNASTDPADPDYNRLDVSYMNKFTGAWEFAQLDFTTNPMTLRRDPVDCRQCHGTPARPFWGSYLIWPGVFGDDPLPGAQPEKLTPRHAQRFRELKNGGGNPERFALLTWANSYNDNSAQFIPNHAYGFAMALFNQSVAYRVTESAYLRMKTVFPTRFNALREELILHAALQLPGDQDRHQRPVGAAGTATPAPAPGARCPGVSPPALTRARAPGRQRGWPGTPTCRRRRLGRRGVGPGKNGKAALVT